MEGELLSTVFSFVIVALLQANTCKYNANFDCLFTASFREKTISEILTCYPEMKAKNDRGKDVIEFGNKYWIMVRETEADRLYPGKDTRM